MWVAEIRRRGRIVSDPDPDRLVEKFLLTASATSSTVVPLTWAT